MALLNVLAVNAGSSSLKLRLLDTSDEVLASSDIPSAGGQIDHPTVADTVRRFPHVNAVGHRFVHGGRRFLSSVRINADVLRELEALTDLAPLHQPMALAVFRTVSDVLPDVPSVACFDTAFHASMPDEAATYAIPERWRGELGVRRYGFHGLAHSYLARRATDFLGTRAGLRIVTCQLGAGASLAAVRDGRSLDTTMGFTPLEGLVMATRSGDVDPGALLWLHEHAGLEIDEISDALEHRSGVFGLAGTADMRDVLTRAASGDARADLAVGVYVHRLSGAIASMAAALGGIDAIVFSGGVGENALAVRARAAERLAFLGVAIDVRRNASSGDREITADGSGVKAFVIAAREELELVRDVRRILGPAPR